MFRGAAREFGALFYLFANPFPPAQKSISWLRSTRSEANNPATMAQNAEVMPKTENGVIATTKATKAPNCILLPKDFASASWREDRMVKREGQHLVYPSVRLNKASRTDELWLFL